MPSLIFNYNNWDLWQQYHKVTFDGVNKLILVNEGVTTLDVQTEVYSDWKEWAKLRSDNIVWSQAISTVGGDPITSETFVGDTYFLENGWRIQPWGSTAGYILDVIGNIYTREPGQNPVNPTPNVSVTLTRSNITETSLVGGTTTTTRLEEIWKILGLAGGQTITDSSITVGDITLTIAQSNVGAGSTTIERS
ncbi:MAG TPA: hypothetical protein DCW83_14370 [Saprospirales bacterium]|nr:hypothetical protein [Saprospirales bacterium]